MILIGFQFFERNNYLEEIESSQSTRASLALNNTSRGLHPRTCCRLGGTGSAAKRNRHSRDVTLSYRSPQFSSFFPYQTVIDWIDLNGALK